MLMAPSSALKAFLRPSKDRPVLDATASASEILTDVVMNGDLVASIPVVGMAVKALRARDAFRDALFAEKLAAFLRSMNEIPEGDRRAMRQLFERDENAKAAGTTLLLVLERLTDLDKPALLGFLLRCFADRRIDALTLRRLAVAVDLAFPEDLREFLGHPLDITFPPGLPEPECRGRLLAAGLTQVAVGITYNSDGNITHPVSEIGRTLHRLVSEDQKLS